MCIVAWITRAYINLIWILPPVHYPQRRKMHQAEANQVGRYGPRLIGILHISTRILSLTFVIFCVSPLHSRMEVQLQDQNLKSWSLELPHSPWISQETGAAWQQLQQLYLNNTEIDDHWWFKNLNMKYHWDLSTNPAIQKNSTDPSAGMQQCRILCHHQTAQILRPWGSSLGQCCN